ncbi:hypothetical protein BC827DRAFT_248442 [Russula dissimulans]|nr:hypothetical protein BC827DRAFT_248442 [Russula dissimulans]
MPAHIHASIPPNVNVEEIAAPQLLGGISNWCLFGVLAVQTYVYSYNFQDDRRLIKLLVYGIFFLETLQTALNGADLYYWFASGFGRFDHLTSPYATAFDVPMIESLVSLAVQCFFMYRIWVLSNKKSWWLCIFIFLFSIVSAIAAFTGGVYTHIHERFPTGRLLKKIALIWLTGNTISDLLITVAMVFNLAKSSTKEDYGTKHALVSIVRLTVGTNIITTAVSIVALLMISLYPDKNWFVCPTSVLGKLYSNTLLVSLNNRISIRDRSVSGSGGRNVQSPAVPFPTSPPSSEVTTEIPLPDMHDKGSDSLKFPPLGGLDVHERVINHDIA